MQITVDEIKKNFYKYLYSEGRHWRSKMEACVEYAFWGYNGQEEYLRLVWDEYGIDSLLLVVLDFVEATSGDANKLVPEFLDAVHKLSAYLHDTYADFYDIPSLIGGSNRESHSPPSTAGDIKGNDFSMRIEKLGLSHRSCIALLNSGIETVGDLLKLDHLQLEGIEDLGPRGRRAVFERLESLGYDSFHLQARRKTRGSEQWRRVVLDDIVKSMPEDEQIAPFGLLPTDFNASFDYVLDSQPNQRAVTMLHMYYEKGIGLIEIAEQYDITRNRVYQLIQKLLRNMGSQEWEQYLRYGMHSVDEKGVAEPKTTMREEESLETLELSNRAYNQLRRMGIRTISDIQKLDYKHVINANGMGKKLLAEIVSALEDRGFVCAHLKEI